jgi:gamma-glutamyltranspeptidase / glutathione hydrolase
MTAVSAGRTGAGKVGHVRDGRESTQVWGAAGAASTAHPLATEAARTVLMDGGGAVDAAVAAQAALAVVAPQACGVGGDAIVLVREPGGRVTSFHGAGRWSEAAGGITIRDDGSSVTVPGAVAAWDLLVDRFGRRSLAEDLAPAVRLAEEGFVPDASLLEGIEESRARLERGGARGWSLVESSAAGATAPQPELARTLRAIADDGPDAFYRGALADAMIRAVRDHGGALTKDDLASHQTREGAPLEMTWDGLRIWFARPPSQAILLGIALRALERFGPLPDGRADHLRVEAMLGAFGLRDRVAEGSALLEEPVLLDADRARGATGALPFLHTAGVSVAAADGWVVSSLVSVFESFGSATFVPEGGFTLNNRAACFTNAPNDPQPGKLPVHTLSPVLIEAGGEVRTLATPGGDGQVQSLLQVVTAHADTGDWESAMAAPRWKCESSGLLIERSHPGREALGALGHRVDVRDDGDGSFGEMTSAGIAGGRTFALSDWRRSTSSGVV